VVTNRNQKSEKQIAEKMRKRKEKKKKEIEDKQITNNRGKEKGEGGLRGSRKGNVFGVHSKRAGLRETGVRG